MTRAVSLAAAIKDYVGRIPWDPPTVNKAGQGWARLGKIGQGCRMSVIPGLRKTLTRSESRCGKLASIASRTDTWAVRQAFVADASSSTVPSLLTWLSIMLAIFLKIIIGQADGSFAPSVPQYVLLACENALLWMGMLMVKAVCSL